MDAGLVRGLETLLVVAAVAALAPLVVALLPGPRVPQVVVLIAGGVLVGPEVLASGRRRAFSCSRTSGSASCSCSPGMSWTCTYSPSGPGGWA